MHLAADSWHSKSLECWINLQGRRHFSCPLATFADTRTRCNVSVSHTGANGGGAGRGLGQAFLRLWLHFDVVNPLFLQIHLQSFKRGNEILTTGFITDIFKNVQWFGWVFFCWGFLIDGKMCVDGISIVLTLRQLQIGSVARWSEILTAHLATVSWGLEGTLTL